MRWKCWIKFKQGFRLNTHNSWTKTIWISVVSHTVLIFYLPHIDGLMQKRRNSSANALELRLSCTNPSLCRFVFQIFYWREEVPGQHVKTVAATETQAILEDLEMFTEYTLVMLAFNAAGDGPNTTIPITALTTEGGKFNFCCCCWIQVKFHKFF